METFKENGNHARSSANRIASNSVNSFKNSKENKKKKDENMLKKKTVDKVLINSPWLLYTILYFALLITDAFIMQPIIEVLVSHGLKLAGPLYLGLFIVIYIILVTALTIGIAQGIAKYLDDRLLDLQVSLESISRPNVAPSVLRQEVEKDKKSRLNFSIIFVVVLMIILVSLSLLRNHLINDYEIRFDTPADWLNLILPIALGITLIFFGIYKDVLVKYITFKNQADKAARLETIQDAAYKEYGMEAIEQDDIAVKLNATLPRSADLDWVLWNFKVPEVNSSSYDIPKVVRVKVVNGNLPVSYVQIYAITDQDVIYAVTNSEGLAEITWNSDAKSLNSISVSGYQIHGQNWTDGSELTCNLQDIIRINNENLEQRQLNPGNFYSNINN